MDQVVVDCGDLAVRAGDPVELFGTGEEGGPTAREWADELGTIHYEIVTGIRGRVRRTVHGERPGDRAGATRDDTGVRAAPGGGTRW